MISVKNILDFFLVKVLRKFFILIYLNCILFLLLFIENCYIR